MTEKRRVFGSLKLVGKVETLRGVCVETSTPPLKSQEQDSSDKVEPINVGNSLFHVDESLKRQESKERGTHDRFT